MPWLQRLLFKVLRWLKANSYNTTVTYQTIEIDTQDIFTALMKNRYDVEALYNKRARYVIMGPNDFMRFTKGAEAHDMMRIHFSAALGTKMKPNILGLEVVIVPWIDGFFVLPDLEQERAISLGA